MKKHRDQKRLPLSVEVVRKLEDGDLRIVAGGYSSVFSPGSMMCCYCAKA